MSHTPLPIVRTFMTHEMGDAEIAALATGREEEFERVIDAIQRSRRSAPGTLQHVVLYGSRGFGKSFMTRRVQIASAEMGGKDGSVQFVLLAEEQHNLQRNPHAFLDLIAEHLKQARGDTTDSDAAFKATMFQWPKPGDEGRRWDEAAARLDIEVDAALGDGRGLVIAVVENFDTLLATLFKEGEDEQRLRRWLDRADNRIMLFATATGTVDIPYDRPLFQAFESIWLQPWTPDDCVEYFNRLRRLEGRGELTPAETAKARAIAEFIGGTPRLAQLLAEVIDTQEALTVADTMSALADRLAEYYRRRIDDLPQLARGLLDALIRGGEPASQTSLAERVGAGGQNIIARTMADLERADIIRGWRAPDSREKLYSVTDRVFVHYYRLRQGSLVARLTPLATILDFLKSFYSRDEQLAQALRHLEAGRPAEAGLFSRLAAEGVARSANEYLDRFNRRLELYVDGLSETERQPILDMAKRLEETPEESYSQCEKENRPNFTVSALCAVIKAQALQRMELTSAAREAFNEAAGTTNEDASAIVNCERYLFFRDVVRDEEGASEAATLLEDFSKISTLGIRLGASVLVAAHWRSLGKRQDAIRLLQPMVEEACSAGKQAIEIQLLSQLVVDFAEARQFADALKVCERLVGAVETGTSVINSAALGQIAILCLELGDYDRAVEAAKRSVQLAQTAENLEVEALSQNSLARALIRKGDKAQVEEIYVRISEIAREMADGRSRAIILRRCAEILMDLERFDEAADVAGEAVSLLDSRFTDEERLRILRTAASSLGGTDRDRETLVAAQKVVELAERLHEAQAEVTARAQVAFTHLSMGDLDSAWKSIDHTVTIVRGGLAPQMLPSMLMLSASIGARLGRAEAVQNFVEGLETFRENSDQRPDMSLFWASAIFIGSALADDFASLDAILVNHGDWLIANGETLFFTQEDGSAIGRMAEALGRAGIYKAMAGLLPRIADFMAKLPSENRDPTWLPDLMTGFAATCRDPGLLRDVAELLPEALAPQAGYAQALLRDLANVDESENAETVLARLNPDTATLIRRLRGIPAPKPLVRRRKSNGKRKRSEG